MSNVTSEISTNPLTGEETEVKPVTKWIAGKFNGVFAGAQLGAYNLLLAFDGISKKVAHKVCMDLGAQMGLAIREDEAWKNKFTKANKNGEFGMKFTGELRNRHNAMSICYVAQTIDELHKQKMVSKRTMPQHLSISISDYLVECEQWSAKQEWA